MGETLLTSNSEECIAVENKGLVQMVLDCGADVNAIITEESTYEGFSTFGYACRQASADIVKLLLDSEADLSLKDKRGYLPIQRAFCSEKKEVTDIFWSLGVTVEEVNDLSLLGCAVRSTLEENVNKLLQMGADVNGVDRFKNTALHVAVIAENLRMIECLVESGADINKVGYRNKTALEKAASRQTVGVVKFLVGHGADVEKQYPLHAAIKKKAKRQL